MIELGAKNSSGGCLTDLQEISNNSFCDSWNISDGEYYPREDISSVSLVYVGIILAVGIVGNFATVLVQCREQYRLRVNAGNSSSGSSANVFSKNYSQYLISIAINNLCALLTLLISFLRTFGVSFTEESYFTCNIATFLGYSGSFLCPWYIVFLTVERFIAVRYPLKAKLIITERRTTLLLLGITAISIIYNSWLLIGLEAVNPDNVSTMTCSMRPAYRSLLQHFIMANLVTMFSIPISILIILNTWIIIIIYGRNLKRISTQVKSSNKSGSTECDTMMEQPKHIHASRPNYSILSTAARRAQFHKISKPGLSSPRTTYNSEDAPHGPKVNSSLNLPPNRISALGPWLLTPRESISVIRNMRPRVLDAIPKDDFQAMKKLILVSIFYLFFNLPTYVMRLLAQLEVMLPPMVGHAIYFIFIAQFSLHSSIYSTLVTLRKKGNSGQIGPHPSKVDTTKLPSRQLKVNNYAGVGKESQSTLLDPSTDVKASVEKRIKFSQSLNRALKSQNYELNQVVAGDNDLPLLHHDIKSSEMLMLEIVNPADIESRPEFFIDDEIKSRKSSVRSCLTRNDGFDETWVEDEEQCLPVSTLDIPKSKSYRCFNRSVDAGLCPDNNLQPGSSVPVLSSHFIVQIK